MGDAADDVYWAMEREMASRDDMMTHKVSVLRKKEKAMLCHLVEDENAENEFWLPYSQINIIHINQKKNEYTVEVPLWLCEEKGIAGDGPEEDGLDEICF